MNEQSGTCEHMYVTKGERVGDFIELLCTDCGAVAMRPVTLRANEEEVVKLAQRITNQEEARHQHRLATNPPPVFTASPTTEDVKLFDESQLWLVKDVLPQGAFALLTAQAKVGKTVMLYNLALDLLNGEEFLGHFDVPNAYEKRVLYVNMDESSNTFRRTEQNRGPHERLHVMHREVTSFDVRDATHTKALAQMCANDDYGIVLIDSWTACYRGNLVDQSEVRRAMDNLQDLIVQAELDSLVLVTHAGWSTGSITDVRSRDASAIESVPDVLWRYAKKEDKSRWLAWEGRIAPSEYAYEIEFDRATEHVWVSDANVEGSNAWKRKRDNQAEQAARADAKARIVQLAVATVVADSPGINKRGVRIEVPHGTKAVDEALATLTENGVLRIEEQAGSKQYYPADGVEALVSDLAATIEDVASTQRLAG